MHIAPHVQDASISQEEWECLYANAYPRKPMPAGKPTRSQVYQALAKLGGFLNTKQTNIVGWQTLWTGHYRFKERLGAWKLAKSFFNQNDEKM